MEMMSFCIMLMSCIWPECCNAVMLCVCVRWWGWGTRGWRRPGTASAWRCSGPSPPGSAWPTPGVATSTCRVRSSCQRWITRTWCCSVPGCWWTSMECRWPKQVRSLRVGVCEMSLSACICNIFLCPSSINEQSSILNCKISITIYFTFQQINMALSLRTSCWSMTNWTNRWEKLLSNTEEVPGRFESFNVSKVCFACKTKRKTSFVYFHTGVIMESDPVLTVFRLMWV